MAKFQHIKEILVRNFELLINLASGEVARQFGLHVNDIRGNRRTQDVAYKVDRQFDEPQEVRQVAGVVAEVDRQFGRFNDFNGSGFTA